MREYYNRRANEIASAREMSKSNGYGGGKRKVLFTQLNGFDGVGKLVSPWIGFF